MRKEHTELPKEFRDEPEQTMPRRRVKYPVAQGIPPGVQQAIQAEAMVGMPTAEIARQYGVDPVIVRKLASNLSEIDAAHIATLKAKLPDLCALNAAAHLERSLDQMHINGALAVKHTFGAKLSIEAARIAAPAAEAPGRVVLNFVQNLTVAKGPSPEPIIGAVVEVAAVEAIQAPIDPAPSDLLIGPLDSIIVEASHSAERLGLDQTPQCPQLALGDHNAGEAGEGALEEQASS